MATTRTERYVRVTLLTFTGGTWISKTILTRELDRTPFSPTIDVLLQHQKQRLIQKRCKGIITGRQFEILFPASGDDTNVDEWDLSLLIKVVKLLFKSALPGNEISDLETILKIRNEVVCHARYPSLEELEFNTCWTQLALSMCRLASAFDEDVKTFCSNLIQKLSRGPLDLQASIEKLAQLCRNDELMDHALDCLGKIERTQTAIASGLVSANNKLDELIAKVNGLQQIHEHGQFQAEIPMLNSNIVIRGKAEDDVKLVEEIVLKVIRSAIKQDDSAIKQVNDPKDNANIRSSVKQFLADLTSKGAVAHSAESGSIILIIKCNDLYGLANMLDLFRRDGNGHRLVGIEHALTYVFEGTLEVNLVLPDNEIESLSSWIDNCLSQGSSTGDLPYKKELNLGIQCNSFESTVEVLNYFKSGDAANRLNQLSEAVSAALNDNIRIDAELDLEGFAGAIDKFGIDNDITRTQPTTMIQEETHSCNEHDKKYMVDNISSLDRTFTASDPGNKHTSDDIANIKQSEPHLDDINANLKHSLEDSKKRCIKLELALMSSEEELHRLRLAIQAKEIDNKLLQARVDSLEKHGQVLVTSQQLTIDKFRTALTRTDDELRKPKINLLQARVDSLEKHGQVLVTPQQLTIDKFRTALTRTDNVVRKPMINVEFEQLRPEEISIESNADRLSLTSSHDFQAKQTVVKKKLLQRLIDLPTGYEPLCRDQKRTDQTVRYYSQKRMGMSMANVSTERPYRRNATGMGNSFAAHKKQQETEYRARTLSNRLITDTGEYLSSYPMEMDTRKLEDDTLYDRCSPELYRHTNRLADSPPSSPSPTLSSPSSR